MYLYYSILINQCFLSGHCHFIIAISIAMYVGTLWKCAVSSLYPFILLPFLYDLMKKKIICLPTYPTFSDRVGSGETKIFLNVALSILLYNVTIPMTWHFNIYEQDKCHVHLISA